MDWTLYLIDDRDVVTSGRRNSARLAVYKVNSMLLRQVLLSGAVKAGFKQWMNSYQPTAYSVETVTPYTDIRVRSPSTVDTFVHEVHWEQSPPIQMTPWCRSNKFPRFTGSNFPDMTPRLDLDIGVAYYDDFAAVAV